MSLASVSKPELGLRELSIGAGSGTAMIVAIFVKETDQKHLFLYSPCPFAFPTSPSDLQLCLYVWVCFPIFP